MLLIQRQRLILVAPSTNRREYLSEDPNSSRTRSRALALDTAARIFSSFLTMPGSAFSRPTSRLPNRATFSGSNPANARRKFRAGLGTPWLVPQRARAVRSAPPARPLRGRAPPVRPRRVIFRAACLAQSPSSISEQTQRRLGCVACPTCAGHASGCLSRRHAPVDRQRVPSLFRVRRSCVRSLLHHLLLSHRPAA